MRLKISGVELNQMTALDLKDFKKKYIFRKVIL